MSKVPSSTNRISERFRIRLTELVINDESSIVDFSKKVKISLSVINNAIRFGIIPSLRILIKIADNFEISLTYLLGLDNDNNFIPSVLNETFIERFDQLKKERNLKESQIANVMPFTRNFISEWRRNNTLPSLDYLSALAYYFKVSIDYLLGRTDYKN